MQTCHFHIKLRRFVAVVSRFVVPGCRYAACIRLGRRKPSLGFNDRLKEQPLEISENSMPHHLSTPLCSE
nr:unnamed protein product [Haemonchus contortus]